MADDTNLQDTIKQAFIDAYDAEIDRQHAMIGAMDHPIGRAIYQCLLMKIE